MRAQIRLLPDGRRLHLQDGPIDLIIEAFGSAEDVKAAYEKAAERFAYVLDELCDELQLLRQPVTRNSPLPCGAIAQRMMAAVKPYANENFITPMAAVAGAVAEEIMAMIMRASQLDRAYVNNGGDIALHLAPGQHFTAGIVDKPDRPSLFGAAKLDWAEPVRGIATSGWRGRSFSLGIADAVTVLADLAANADAAATVIANAVDVPGHPAVVRVPARELVPDSDLGNRLVTQAVGELSACDVAAALENGERVAEELLQRGLIHSAALRLQDTTRIVAAERGSRRLVHA